MFSEYVKKSLDVVLKVVEGSHRNQNRHRKSPRTSYLWENWQLFKAGQTGTVSILKKKTLHSMTDCLETSTQWCKSDKRKVISTLQIQNWLGRKQKKTK